ncbi:hypothetical protein TNCV_4229141 [Trichonephila clavipes]|nr:hypothetical protein TNCV_4229141 [Trichonephila clavipes]
MLRTPSTYREADDSPNNVFKDMTSYHGLPGHLADHFRCPIEHVMGRAGKATGLQLNGTGVIFNCADSKTMVRIFTGE